MTDPERDRRFWALSAEGHDIAARPDVGRAEVERLAAIFDEMKAILDDLPEERVRRFRERMHATRGRAVDIPPVRSPLDLVFADPAERGEWIPERPRSGDR